jgi:hypothetical protein
MTFSYHFISLQSLMLNLGLLVCYVLSTFFFLCQKKETKKGHRAKAR